MVTARLLLIIGLATGVASCGGDPASDQAQPEPTTRSVDPTPAVCGDVDTLSASFKALQDVKIDREVLRTLSADLRQIDADVRQLADAASDEYADEIDTVKSSVADLELSVKAASATPSSATVSAVGADMRAFGGSVEALATAVGGTC